jgi:hypothetical protein
LAAMNFVPFGLGWIDLIMAMPLVVLAAWACGVQADDYPELFKLGLVALAAPWLSLLILWVAGRALVQAGAFATLGAAAVGTIMLLLFLLSAGLNCLILALACKRLISVSWREAWLFGAIVALGNAAVSLLLRALK